MRNETQDTTAKVGEEQQSAETEHTEQPAAADEASAGEAKETQDGEKQAGEDEEHPTGTKKSPETHDKKEHNREGFTQRKRIRELELENARLKGFQEGLRATGKEEPRPDVATDIESLYAKEHPEPKSDQFDTNEEFVKAVGKWNRGLTRFEQEHTDRRSRDTETQSIFDKRVVEQRTKGEKKYDDFREVVGDTEYSQVALAAIIESPIGEDIAYFLATNPDEHDRIKTMNPILQAREIGRIEAKLEKTTSETATATKDQKKEPKRISTAPEPAPKPKGQAPMSVDAEYMSDSTSTNRRIELSRQRRAAEQT